MIAEGRYRAKRVDVMTENGPKWGRFRKSATKGTPYVELVFRLLDGPDKDAELYWSGYLSDKAATRTVEALHALGMVGSDVRALEFQDLNREVEIEIEHDTYKGKTTPKIRGVYAIAAGELNLEELAERVKRIVAGDAFGGDDVGF